MLNIFSDDEKDEEGEKSVEDKNGNLN